MRYIVLLVLALGATSCGNTQVIEDLHRPLTDLQSITDKILPGGRDRTSRNGREVYSKSFVQNSNGDFEVATNQPVARMAVIKILGDRRPYDVTIQVFRQARGSDGTYSNAGSDESVARVLKRRFDKALHQRREDRSIVDEFKAF